MLFFYHLQKKLLLFIVILYFLKQYKKNSPADTRVHVHSALREHIDTKYVLPYIISSFFYSSRIFLPVFVRKYFAEISHSLVMSVCVCWEKAAACICVCIFVQISSKAFLLMNKKNFFLLSSTSCECVKFLVRSSSSNFIEEEMCVSIYVMGRKINESYVHRITKSILSQTSCSCMF